MNSIDIALARLRRDLEALRQDLRATRLLDVHVAAVLGNDLPYVPEEEFSNRPWEVVDGAMAELYRLRQREGHARWLLPRVLRSVRATYRKRRRSRRRMNQPARPPR
jgi:hypothetical protein